MPDAVSIWALLGTAMNQSSRQAEGVILLLRARNLDPLNPAIHSNLGNAFKELNQLGDAINSLKCALSIAPTFADAQKNLGSSLISLNDQHTGLMHLERALKINPLWPEAHLAVGVGAGKYGLCDKGLNACKSAISLDPNYAQAYLHTGEALISMTHFSQALIAFSRAIHLDQGCFEAYLGRGRAFHGLDNHVEALKNFDAVEAGGLALEFPTAMARAATLMAMGQREEALLTYERAIRLKEDAFDAHLGKAQVLSATDRHNEAISYAKWAVALSPNQVDAYLILADALYEQGDNVFSLAIFDRAIIMADDIAEAQVNKSIILLKNGDYQAGWALYGKRLETKSLDNEQEILRNKMCQRGFKGDKLWVWCEQGVGDQIFLGGILEDIRKNFSQIIVTLDPRIVPIFSRSFKDITFTDQTELPSHAYDGHLPMASLPLVFEKFMGETRPHAYLRSDAARTAELSSLLHKKGKILCGLSWQSQRKGVGGDKSLGLKDLLPLLKLPNFEFISLQYGDVASQLAEFKEETGIVIRQHAAIDNFSDLDGLASLIDACDLVISTCNSTVHLAGALGKETHLLAPLRGKAQQWYWAPSGDQMSPWYPSINVYHQGEGRDWNKPLREAHARIQARWDPNLCS